MHTTTLKRHLCIVILLCLSACKNQKKESLNDKVFRYNEHANITSLDPAFAKDQRNIWPCNQLYNGLVQLDDSLKIKPDLAKRWEISEDALTYTFFLRDDVYFHKHKIFGKDSTRSAIAQDVVYSLKRLTDKKIASPGSWVMQNLASVKAKNDTIVEFKLKQASPAFLGLLSMQYCSVLPVEMEDLNFRNAPIGTGPFKFKRWEPNEKLVFRKNNLYFEKDNKGKALPYLEAIAITFLPDKQSEFLQFAQGKLDFISGLDNSYKDELLSADGELRKQYSSSIKMLSAPYLNTEYLGIYMDSKTPETASKKLRKAMNYGFDRKKMLKYLRNGIGTPAEYGFIPKGLPGFSEKKYYPYNLQKAKQLIREYQQETESKRPEIIISTNASYLDLVEYIQRELQKVGFSVTVDVMPPSTLLQQRSAGKLAIFRSSWIADYPDAENYLSLFYSKNFSPNGPNYTHFQSTYYDSLYKTAQSISSIKKRIPLYQKMDSLLMENAPVIPLYYDQAVRFSRENVKNLGINPINLLDIKQVKKIP